VGHAPSESKRAHGAFCLYRDFGAQRSLAKVLRQSKGIPEGTAVTVPSHWERWSKKHEWVARADAYDAHQDALDRARRDQETAQLAGIRQAFEIERQRAKQKRILDFDAVLDKYQQEAALSIRDLTQDKTVTEMVNGQPKTTHTVTRFKAIKGGDMAKVAQVQSLLEAQAINGLRDKANDGRDGPVGPKAIIPDWLVQDLRSQGHVDIGEATPAVVVSPVQQKVQ
jgi:hypothetical protein